MLRIAAGQPLINLIQLAYSANQPVLLHGMHGVGKSEILDEAAQSLGIQFIVRDLSLMEPPDLVGIPQVRPDGTTHYAPPSFLPTSGKGLIVFEELNRCPRYMQSPCLQLLTSRLLNDYQLPAGWLPCAAINDVTDGYFADELDPALLSRFLRVKVVANVDEWVKWARASKLHKEIVEFVQNSPNIFEDPSANPRAWTYASRLLTEWQHCEPKDNDLLLIVLAGVLNEKWAYAFYQNYCDLKRPLKPTEIIEDYSAYQSSVRRWIQKGQLDVVKASVENLKRYIQKQNAYNTVVQKPALKSNVESFLLDLPAELLTEFREWSEERGFRRLTL